MVSDGFLAETAMVMNSILWGSAHMPKSNQWILRNHYRYFDFVDFRRNADFRFASFIGVLEKVVASAIIKMDIFRERRANEEKARSKHRKGADNAPAGIPAPSEHSLSDDYTEETTIEDLFDELEEMEDFELDDEVDAHEESRTITVASFLPSDWIIKVRVC